MIIVASARHGGLISPGVSDWPNEPGGFTKITERRFDAVVENSWFSDSGPDAGTGIVTDGTAPKSPSNVGDWHFNTVGTFYDGGDPWNTAFDISSLNYTQLYSSYWVKLSSNWKSHNSGVNKISFVWISNTTPEQPQSPTFFGLHRGDGTGAGPLLVEPQVQNCPDDRAGLSMPHNLGTDADATCTRGQWNRFEWVIRTGNNHTSGPRGNGEIHCWLNGVKTHQLTDVAFSYLTNPTWQILNVVPIWGGAGDSLASGDIPMDFYCDHYYASGKV